MMTYDETLPHLINGQQTVILNDNIAGSASKCYFKDKLLTIYRVIYQSMDCNIVLLLIIKNNVTLVC